MMGEGVASLNVDEQELRVAGQTATGALASAIVKNIDDGKRVVLSCIGCMPTLLAAKAVAAANGLIAPHGYVLYMLPTFHVTKFPHNEERTAMHFVLVKQRIGS
jgi:stage V sporulation protein SpoVS